MAKQQAWRVSRPNDVLSLLDSYFERFMSPRKARWESIKLMRAFINCELDFSRITPEIIDAIERQPPRKAEKLPWF